MDNKNISENYYDKTSNAHLTLEDAVQKRAEVYASEQFQSLVKEAEKVVRYVQPQEVDLNDLSILFLDVRETEEFASGYLRKDMHLTIPRGKLEFVAIKKILEKYGKDIPILTYCFKGPRGLLSAEVLHKMGFTNVQCLEGGLEQWMISGRTLRSYFGEIKLHKSKKELKS